MSLGCHGSGAALIEAASRSVSLDSKGAVIVTSVC